MRSIAPVVLALLLLALVPLPVAGEEVSKKISFEFDRWYDLGLKDGPVELHRLRVVRLGSGSLKSRLSRPSGEEYFEDVRIEIEFSNDSTSDWEVRGKIEWLDADGRAIDGFRGKEELNDGSAHEVAKVTLPTLRYGLDRARRLLIELRVGPE